MIVRVTIGTLGQMAEITYGTKEAGDIIGVVHSTMRKIAQDYEAVYGSLGDPRVFTQEILERIKQARNMYDAGLVPSVRVALETLKDPESSSLPVVQEPVASPEMLRSLMEQVVSPLLAELQASRQEALKTRQQLKQLEAEMEALRSELRQLPAPAGPSVEDLQQTVQPLQEQLNTLEVNLRKVDVPTPVDIQQAVERAVQPLQAKIEMLEQQARTQNQQTPRKSFWSRLFGRSS